MEGVGHRGGSRDWFEQSGTACLSGSNVGETKGSELESANWEESGTWLVP